MKSLFCYSESPVVKETAQTVRKENKNSLFKKKGREKEKEKEQDKEKREEKEREREGRVLLRLKVDDRHLFAPHSVCENNINNTSVKMPK